MAEDSEAAAKIVTDDDTKEAVEEWTETPTGEEVVDRVEEWTTTTTTTVEEVCLLHNMAFWYGHCVWCFHMFVSDIFSREWVC